MLKNDLKLLPKLLISLVAVFSFSITVTPNVIHADYDRYGQRIDNNNSSSNNNDNDDNNRKPEGGGVVDPGGAIGGTPGAAGGAAVNPSASATGAGVSTGTVNPNAQNTAALPNQQQNFNNVNGNDTSDQEISKTNSNANVSGTAKNGNSAVNQENTADVTNVPKSTKSNKSALRSGSTNKQQRYVKREHINNGVTGQSNTFEKQFSSRTKVVEYHKHGKKKVKVIRDVHHPVSWYKKRGWKVKKFKYYGTTNISTNAMTRASVSGIADMLSVALKLKGSAQQTVKKSLQSMALSLIKIFGKNIPKLWIKRVSYMKQAIAPRNGMKMFIQEKDFVTISKHKKKNVILRAIVYTN